MDFDLNILCFVLSFNKDNTPLEAIKDKGKSFPNLSSTLDCLWQTKNVGYGTSFMHVL